MAYTKFGSLIERVNTTPTSGGTLILVNSSQTYQQFTGSTTHNVQLPQANAVSPNECPIGLSYVILNRSTGSIIVKFNSGATAITLVAASQTTLRLIDNTTLNGTWDATIETSSGTTTAVLSSSENIALGSTLAQGYYEDSNSESAQININLEEIGGDYSLSKASTSQARSNSSYFALNGLLYTVAGVVSAVTQTTNERFNTDMNYWLSCAALTSALQSGSGYSDGTYGYVVGGAPSGLASAFATNYQYNDGINAWATKSSLGTAKWGHGCYSTGTYGYATPGTTNLTPGAVTTTEAYSQPLDIWYVRQTTYFDSAVEGGAPAFYNGFGYIVNPSTGWSSGPTGITASRRYNEVTNTHTLVASTVTPRSWAGAYVASSMFVHGGYVSLATNTPVTSKEQFIDSANIWLTRSNPATARAEVAGGQSSVNYIGYGINGWITGSTYSNLVEEFHDVMYIPLPITKKTNTVPTNVFASIFIGDKAYALPTKVRTDGNNWKYIVGNSNVTLKLNETTPIKFVESGVFGVAAGNTGTAAEVYSVAQNTWTNKATLPSAGRDCLAGFALSGVAYVPSGYTGTTTVTNVDSLNETTNAWTAKTGVNTSVMGLGFRTNGFGYLTGGCTGNLSTTYQNAQQYNSTANTWTTKSIMNSVHFLGISFELLGRGMAATGSNANNTASIVSTIEIYNDATDVWTNSSASMATGRTQSGGFPLNGYGYSFNGVSSVGANINNSEKFDSGLNVWTTLSVFPASALETDPSGAAIDGFGYSAGGGLGTATPITNSYVFNDASVAWSAIAALNTATNYATANFTPGFYRNYEMHVGVPIYLASIGSGVWTTVSNMTTNHNVCGEFSLEGFGYSFGGFIGGGGSTAQMDRYDEVIDAWVQSVSMSGAVYDPADFVLEGRGHRSGGVGSTVHEAFSPSIYSWTTLALSPYTTNIDFAQGASLNGKGYMLGGSAVNDAAYYSNSTNTWTVITGPGAGLTSARWGQGGFIYCAGADTPSTSVQKYNDVTTTWSSAPSMNVARRNHVTLIGGRALIAGSITSYVTSSEQFNETGSFWISGATMPVGVGGQAVFTLNDSAYSAGGWNGTSVLSTQKFSPSLKNAVLGASLKVS